MKLSFRKKLNQAGMLSLHTLLPIAAAVIVVGGVGAYVLKSSSAAGWSYVGEVTNTGSVTLKFYACKSAPVPKKGYMVKSRIVVSKALSSQPSKTNYYIRTVIGYNFASGKWITAPVKIGQTSETAYVGYGSASSTAKIMPRISDVKNGTMLDTMLGSPKDVIIGNLSTCP